LKRALAAACALLTVASARAADVAPADFAYGMKVVTPGDAAGYRASLPLPVYQKVLRADLGDVRMFNGKGEVVPFTIERPRSSTTEAEPVAPSSLPVFTLRGDPTVALDAVKVTLAAGNTTINVQAPGTFPVTGPIRGYLVDGRSLDVAVSVMQVGWADEAPDFAGRLRVEASDDLDGWRTLVDGAAIANLHAGQERLIERRIELPASHARFWRLTWTDEAAPFEITSVTAEPARGRVDVERATQEVEGVPVEAAGGDRNRRDRDSGERERRTRDSTDGQSVNPIPGEFTFDLGAQAPVDRVNLELPEQNTIVEVTLSSRPTPGDAWRPVVTRGFYRLRSSGPDVVNGAVAISTNTDRYWRVKADTRGGGFGSGAPKLRVGWLPHEVLFLARGGGPFTLAYGSADAEVGAAGFPALPVKTTVLRATFAEPETLGGIAKLTPTPRSPDYVSKSAVLWGVLIIGVGLLAVMVYRLLREMK
jgi:Protein of unknown function (DUF3999)